MTQEFSLVQTEAALGVFLQHYDNLRVLRLVSRRLRDQVDAQVTKIKISRTDSWLALRCGRMRALRDMWPNLQVLEGLFIPHSGNFRFIRHIPKLYLSTYRGLKTSHIVQLGTWNLRALKIHNCNNDIFDKAFASLVTLEQLSVWGCKYITDAGLVHLVNLHSLNAGNTSITGACFAYLPKLRLLNASWCKAFNSESLAFLGCIQQLDIGGTNVLDDHVRKLEQVHTLQVDCCKCISAAAFAGLAHMRVLSAGYTEIDDTLFANIAAVEKLSLVHCKNITGRGFGHLRRVHHLAVSFCSRLCDDGLRELRVPLQTLLIERCEAITDAAFAHLRVNHFLDITGCRGLTDAALCQLRGLQCLSTSAHQITVDGMIKHVLPELQKLCVNSYTSWYTQHEHDLLAKYPLRFVSWYELRQNANDARIHVEINL